MPQPAAVHQAANKWQLLSSLRKNAYDADKPKRDLGRLTMTFGIAFPDGEVGDKARHFAGRGQQPRRRSCAVSRAAELGPPITRRME